MGTNMRNTYGSMTDSRLRGNDDPKIKVRQSSNLLIATCLTSELSLTFRNGNEFLSSFSVDVTDVDILL
jgi:hypothetical protein